MSPPERARWGRLLNGKRNTADAQPPNGPAHTHPVPVFPAARNAGALPSAVQSVPPRCRGPRAGCASVGGTSVRRGSLLLPRCQECRSMYRSRRERQTAAADAAEAEAEAAAVATRRSDVAAAVSSCCPPLVGAHSLSLSLGEADRERESQRYIPSYMCREREDFWPAKKKLPGQFFLAAQKNLILPAFFFGRGCSSLLDGGGLEGFGGGSPPLAVLGLGLGVGSSEPSSCPRCCSVLVCFRSSLSLRCCFGRCWRGC